MKIVHLISALPPVILNNQEKDFLDKHKDTVSLENLNEQDLWLAQNLVRKGVYKISKDNNTLIKNTK